MAATAYAAPATLFGSELPKVCKTPRPRSHFGDLALVAFLLTQCFDGVLTYVGVADFGIAIEANPIVASLMTHLGHGLGLLCAKIVAAILGISLHLLEIHAAVAVLAAFYVTAAIAPWTLILLW